MTECSACTQEAVVDKNRDKDLRVTLQVNEVALDITGYKVWFSVKSALGEPDTDALIFKRNLAAGGDDSEIKITDGPAGILYIYIKPADTADLEAGDYWFDVVVESPIPRKFQAVKNSTFKIRDTVTVTS